MVIIKTQTFTTERELNDFIMEKMTDPAKKDPLFKVRNITPLPIPFSIGVGKERSMNSTIYYVLEFEETLQNKDVKSKLKK